MRNSRNVRNEAGFTLIEILIASGVVAVGMVLMMQCIVSLYNQSRVTDAAVAASNFSTSILESMHDMEFVELARFNSDGLEFMLEEDGTMILQGIGNVTVNVYAVIANDGGLEKFSIPISEEEAAEYAESAPNPLEIQIEILTDGYQFHTSTLVYHL